MNILRQGNAGYEVRALQALLYFYGLIPAKGIDGIFGSDTKSKLEILQKEFKLDQDGVCGPKTWEAILKGPIVPISTSEIEVPDKPIKTSTYGSDVEKELSDLFSTCIIEDTERFEWDVAKCKAERERYEVIAKQVNSKMPWWFVAVIHGLECSYSFTRHLHNGDSLRGKTHNVPANRPPGNPPFSFEESAIDALTMPGKAYNTVSDWSIPAILFRLEGFNGYGYRMYHGIHSPYLWSGTNHYTKGKYTSDGKYDPNFVSKQAGAAGIIKILLT